ncbi:hypothetical protein [Sphingopyxis sp.]|jgi:hypothetical protein|uniref:hypothetical protein n=1 Tax=Sphingopyxis sp. TaxID=1908224 RepID=UPI003F71F28A
MRAALGAAAAVAFVSAASAHPHAHVDQQALLSLGRTKAVLTFAITPSTKDGAHMFSHLDANGNGLLEASEKAAFAESLLAQTYLTADGARIKLRVTYMQFPGRRAMAAGTGAIRISSEAPVSLPASSRHRLDLMVAHSGFAEGWTLQAFYYRDLLSGRSVPSVSRNPKIGSLGISVPSG